MHLAPAGDRALLADLGDVTAAELHAANAAALTVPGVVKSIPGHSSLYVIFSGPPNHELLRSALNTASNQQPATSNATHHVPVAFDGEDLPAFLEHTGVTIEALLARVDGMRLVARYLGFRGGFAYLDGWPAEWAMPRRATSRPVRRGSFAIAGSVAAFYPIDTPGGWNVLGRTDVDLENAIAAGDVIRLQVLHSERSEESMEPSGAANFQGDAPAGTSAASRSGRFLRALREGAVDSSLRSEFKGDILGTSLATWTPTPFDDVAAAIANHAVGNDATAALFECPLAGPRLRFAQDALIAWCTPSLDVTVDRVRAGEERAFGRVTGGLRAYLAIGEREGTVAKVARGDRRVIRAMAGPHDGVTGDIECEVTPQLDRVGIRLRPLRALHIHAPADLRSTGMQCGTVQLHPDGSLVAMGPDHPVTGGYLQPMTVLSEERWKLAQLVPGERVTFSIG